MPEPRDECRPVTLPSGETIRVRSAAEPSPEAVAALGVVVDAVRAKLAAEHRPDGGADGLWERLESARQPRGLSLRDVASQAGVRFSALFRIGQGRMPESADLARINAWLEERDA
jgi:hypothetical protein